MEVLKAPDGALNLAMALCFWNLLEGETPRPLLLWPWFYHQLKLNVLSNCQQIIVISYCYKYRHNFIVISGAYTVLQVDGALCIFIIIC